MASDRSRQSPHNPNRPPQRQPFPHHNDPRRPISSDPVLDDLAGLYQDSGYCASSSSKPPGRAVPQNIPQPQSHTPSSSSQPAQSHELSPQQYYYSRPPPQQDSSRPPQQYYLQQRSSVPRLPGPHTSQAQQQYAARAQAAPRIAPLERRPNTDVQGQDTDDYSYDIQPWHDSETSTQTSSPDYFSDEEREARVLRGRTNGAPAPHWQQEKQTYMDFERAFPEPRTGVPKAQAHSPYAQYQQGFKQKPLIDYVTNDWRRKDAAAYYSGQYAARRTQNYLQRGPNQNVYDFEEDTGCMEDFEDIFRSKACRRYCLTIILLISTMIWFFIWLVTPESGDGGRMRESLKARLKSDVGFFGNNMHVAMSGTMQVAQLDPWLVPGSTVEKEGFASSGERRLIIIGDIHGCADALNKLLTEVSFNPSTDHLVTTGDMISKGPASLEVLHTLMKHNASCVRGNHEDRVLLAHRDWHAPSHSKLEDPLANSDSSAQPKKQKIKHGATSDLELAADLSDSQISYLQSCPLILDLGHVRGMGFVTVAHAGLVPMVPLTLQDPLSVLNMRSVDIRTHYPSRQGPPEYQPKVFSLKDQNRDRYGRTYFVPWPKLWDMWQSLRPEAEREHVVYGHDSDAGLALGQYTWGLDAACINGGELAALVVGRTSAFDVEKEVVRVKCKDYLPVEGPRSELGGS